MTGYEKEGKNEQGELRKISEKGKERRRVCVQWASSMLSEQQKEVRERKGKQRSKWKRRPDKCTFWGECAGWQPVALFTYTLFFAWVRVPKQVCLHAIALSN